MNIKILLKNYDKNTKYKENKSAIFKFICYALIKLFKIREKSIKIK